MDGFAKDVLPIWIQAGDTGGGQNMNRFAKYNCPNGYRVYLRGTQNMNRFAKDVLPKWI